LPISSVSDFNHFAQKIEKSIATKVKIKEADASAYVLQKQKDTLTEITQWKERSVKQWNQELNALEQREEKALLNDIKQQWSVFKKDHETAFRQTFREALEDSFEALAKCFIAWVSRNYTTGTFTMAKKYTALIENTQFNIQESTQEQIAFASGNLYIEYSVDRIIEELGDEINKHLHLEENEWQV
jgi:hypothetical protein